MPPMPFLLKNRVNHGFINQGTLTSRNADFFIEAPWSKLQGISILNV